MLPAYTLEELPGQADGAPMIQYTTVNIRPEPVVVRDHLIWSLCLFAYSNIFCCLGLAALCFSVKARDRKVAGDMAKARYYGSVAFVVNICTTILVIIAIAVVFYFYVNIRRHAKDFIPRFAN